jgi:uncharacterized protein YlxP (DUF503 family)
VKDAVAWVGVLHLEVGCPGTRSLKEKRALLQPLLHRWRRGYSLSATRLAGLDAHGWERFALAAVDGDRDRLAAVMAAAEAAVGEAGLRVLRARLDVEPWEGLDPDA